MRRAERQRPRRAALSWESVVSFICNLCGARCEVEHFATEPATCACGSNVRLRSLIHLLSLELFDRSLILAEFPRLKAIRGLGMSDKDCCASLLAEKFDYTNTFYDSEPKIDFTERHPQLDGQYDFILSADVLEHVSPPVERMLDECCRLLKPHGFLGVTVFCNPQDEMKEHFPELHEYRIVPLGGENVLINRRRDGTLEICNDLIFHGGSGATLEVREFGATALRERLLGAGFADVHFLTGNVEEIGIYWDHDVSQPLVARKAPYMMDHRAAGELAAQWRQGQETLWGLEDQLNRTRQQLSLAAGSRWMRLGRALGVGPKL